MKYVSIVHEILNTFVERNMEPVLYYMEANGYQTSGSELKVTNWTDFVQWKWILISYQMLIFEFLQHNDLIEPLCPLKSAEENKRKIFKTIKIPAFTARPQAGTHSDRPHFDFKAAISYFFHIFRIAQNSAKIIVFNLLRGIFTGFCHLNRLSWCAKWGRVTFTN